MPVEKTVEELFEEYAGAYRSVDECLFEGEDCQMCVEDKEKMIEIIKEVKQQVRREVVEEIYNLFPRPMWTVSANSIKEYALSKGITLKN